MFHSLTRNRIITAGDVTQTQTVTFVWRNAAAPTTQQLITVASSWCSELDALNDSSWTVGNWSNLQEISLPGGGDSLPVRSDIAAVTATLNNWAGRNDTFVTTRIDTTKTTIAADLIAKFGVIYAYHTLPYAEMCITNIMIVFKEGQ